MRIPPRPFSLGYFSSPFKSVRVRGFGFHPRKKCFGLTLLVFLFPEGCLLILTAIKDAETGYLVSIHLERDHNAFSVADYS
jgi:hypothetical protein